MYNNYYKRIIKQDFINKFKSKKVPDLEKIVLNFGCQNFSMEKFATTMLALEIITGKKGTVTAAKKPNLLLKIQKGQPAGCKVILKKKEVHNFLIKLNLEILPNIKDFSKFRVTAKQSNFFCQLPANSIKLEEFENLYPLFSVLPILDINIFTTLTKCTGILFLSKSLKLAKNTPAKSKITFK